VAANRLASQEGLCSIEEGIEMLAGTIVGERHYSLPCGPGFEVDRNMELFKRTKCNFSVLYRGAAEKESLFRTIISMYGKRCW
jgi:hypothetical protein